MVTAIIVAAGRGTRMGPGKDKVLLELAGRPIAAHTWERFDRSAAIDQIVLVIRHDLEPAFAEMARSYRFRKPFRTVVGGKERQDSVWNGLQAAPAETEIVVIQDAARPCTAEPLIVQTIDAAREIGAAVAAQRVTDTIKESDDGQLIRRTVDRSRLWSVQTPQAFRLGIIRRALEAVRTAGLVVTDDTAACEQIGQPVRLVESKLPNPKATAPGDLPLLEALLSRGGC